MLVLKLYYKSDSHENVHSIFTAGTISEHNSNAGALESIL